MFTYRCYGLAIRSDFELSELGTDPVEPSTPVDVDIQQGPVGARPETAVELPWGLWRDGDVCGIDIPDVARYEVSADEREIVVDPYPRRRRARRPALPARHDARRDPDAARPPGAARQRRPDRRLGCRGGRPLRRRQVDARRGVRAAWARPAVRRRRTGRRHGSRACRDTRASSSGTTHSRRLGLHTDGHERIIASRAKFHVPISRGRLDALPLRWIYVLETQDGRRARAVRSLAGSTPSSLLHEHTYRRELLADRAATCAAPAAVRRHRRTGARRPGHSARRRP